MEDEFLKNRFRSTLLGLAIGDALGAPLELMNQAEIAERFGVVREMLGGGWLNLEPGGVTDDTEMMICIAESLAQKAEFDPDDIARKFLVWYDTHPKDLGNTTQVVLGLLKNDLYWRSAAKKAHAILGGKSAGNGSLMRVAPIGLVFHRYEEEMIKASFTSSKITHWDDIAAESCVAFNLILSDILHGYDQEEAIQNAAAKMLPRSEMVSRSIQSVFEKESDELQPTGFVLDTLETALWYFYHSESFEEALVHAVNRGGDADTIGAVTGALAGAYFGMGELPERWLKVLEGREIIQNLADQLYEISNTLSLNKADSES